MPIVQGLPVGFHVFVLAADAPEAQNVCIVAVLRNDRSQLRLNTQVAWYVLAAPLPGVHPHGCADIAFANRQGIVREEEEMNRPQTTEYFANPGSRYGADTQFSIAPFAWLWEDPAKTDLFCFISGDGNALISAKAVLVFLLTRLALVWPQNLVGLVFQVELAVVDTAQTRRS